MGLKGVAQQGEQLTPVLPAAYNANL